MSNEFFLLGESEKEDAQVLNELNLNLLGESDSKESELSEEFARVRVDERCVKHVERSDECRAFEAALVCDGKP